MKKILLLGIVLSATIVLLCSCDCKHEECSQATCNEPSTCLKCGEIVSNTLGHTDGEWIADKEPNCTEDGSKHQVCAVCKATIKTETLTKLGHTDGEWITDKEPNCTEDGSKHQVCSVCDATTKTETLTKGHKEGAWIVDTEATCAEHGSKHQVCSICSVTINTQVISATGHNFVNLKCSKCEEYSVNINEIGQSYEDKNRLTVTLNTYSVTEHEGYYSYTINYTVENNIPDSKLMPGSFKLFFTDKTGENQYGGFNYLYYGEKSTRSYTWKVLKTQAVLILEYNANDDDAGLESAFFREEPIKDTMHWIVP